MPYREAGLSEREAAAHLLSRFTYGARPGQVDQVVATGLETWWQQQLKPGVSEPRAALDLRELRHRRLLRAVHSDHQLQEVMTDFWFNHFYVSARGVDVRAALADYEETAIRPHVLGLFEKLLEASAHHPAMLAYLNNDDSRADPDSDRMTSGRDPLNYGPRDKDDRSAPTTPMNYGGGLDRPEPAPRPIGINENYARELMELHTLGVDGGYRQEDVVQVARALTGWTVDRSQARWRFRYDDALHDRREKTILKRRFPAGRGQEEGEEVLDLLARHGSTARHVCTKLAVRFVSDAPPQVLVNRLQRRYLGTGGNIALVLDELVRSPEFWAARGQKVKTPLELVASAVRALDGRLQQSDWLVASMQEMGQPLYEYGAPTGFPDRADFWINPGTLTARINFGLHLAAGQVSGVTLPSVEAAGAGDPLEQEVALLLPGRDPGPVAEKLRPLVDDTGFEERMQEKSKRKTPPLPSRPRLDRRRLQGILLGSPDFQRR